MTTKPPMPLAQEQIYTYIHICLIVFISTSLSSLCRRLSSFFFLCGCLSMYIYIYVTYISVKAVFFSLSYITLIRFLSCTRKRRKKKRIYYKYIFVCLLFFTSTRFFFHFILGYEIS